jgi:hypothetical protein
MEFSSQDPVRKMSWREKKNEANMTQGTERQAGCCQCCTSLLQVDITEIIRTGDPGGVIELLLQITDTSPLSASLVPEEEEEDILHHASHLG